MVDQVQCPACGAKVDVPESGTVICPFCKTEFQVGAADASTGVVDPTGDVRVISQPPEIVEPVRDKALEKVEEIRQEAAQSFQSSIEPELPSSGPQVFPGPDVPPAPQVFPASDVRPAVPPRSSSTRTILIVVAVVIVLCLFVTVCLGASLIPALRSFQFN